MFWIILIVLLISLLVCFVDINPASNFEGAKYMPFSIDLFKKLLKRMSSVLMTSFKFLGSFFEKKNPNLPPFCFTA